VLSHRLSPTERQRLRVLSSEFDGVPFTEKAELLRIAVDDMRAHRPKLRLISSPPPDSSDTPAPRAA